MFKCLFDSFQNFFWLMSMTAYEAQVCAEWSLTFFLKKIAKVVPYILCLHFHADRCFLLFKVFVLKYPITEMIRLKIFLKFSGLFSCLVVKDRLPHDVIVRSPAALSGSRKCRRHFFFLSSFARRSNRLPPKQKFVNKNFCFF
jgi:hypothetical protein